MKERVPWQQLLVLFNIRPRKNSRLTTQCSSHSSSLFGSSVCSVSIFLLFCKNRKQLVIVSEICSLILLVCQKDILDIPILFHTPNSPQQVTFRHVPLSLEATPAESVAKVCQHALDSNKKPAPTMSPVP